MCADRRPWLIRFQVFFIIGEHMFTVKLNQCLPVFSWRVAKSVIIQSDLAATLKGIRYCLCCLRVYPCSSVVKECVTGRFLMCGRFEIHSAIEIILKIFQIDSIDFDMKPNYNIAPTQDVAIVIKSPLTQPSPAGERMKGARRESARSCNWGFVPSWAKDRSAGYRMINARAETVATNRVLQGCLHEPALHRACRRVLRMEQEGSSKEARARPAAILQAHGLCRACTISGIRLKETKICTCTIITTDANEVVAPVHDRMPAILPEDQFRSGSIPTCTIRPGCSPCLNRILPKIPSSSRSLRR